VPLALMSPNSHDTLISAFVLVEVTTVCLHSFWLLNGCSVFLLSRSPSL
jgi:hypothetical protein